MKMELNSKCFKTEKIIGHGMFSQVSKSLNILTGEFVAIKSIQLSDLDKKSLKDCIREVELLQHLDHENVIHYISSYQEDNNLYIVLELAEWGDLAKVITHFKNNEKLLSEKTIWKFFSQVTSGLNHMHSKRIMHRDIKPANIFLSVNGAVKIGDLGLSRYFSESTLETFSLLGTPYYMSPERLQQRGYTFSSDIWSLGCLLFEMAALQPPFYAGARQLLLLVKKIELGVRPPIPSAKYSVQMGQLVDDCLKFESSLRPDSQKIKAIALKMLAETS